MISSIFTTLQYFITDRVEDIKYLSLYNNQFNQPDSNRALAMPAVLIEILPINFNDLLNNVQYAEIDVNIHVGTDNYTSFDRGDSMQDASLGHLQILDKLYIALNRVNSEELPEDMKSELFSQAMFKRVGVQLNQYNSSIYHSIIKGKFMFYDLSAVKRYNEYELTDIDVKYWYYPTPPFNGESEAKEVNIN